MHAFVPALGAIAQDRTAAQRQGYLRIIQVKLEMVVGKIHLLIDIDLVPAAFLQQLFTPGGTEQLDDLGVRQMGEVVFECCGSFHD
jgi:hypothetical protein